VSFPRYPKYKESGVEWLGEVPEHWQVEPLYGTVTERAESNEGMVEENLLSLSYGRIVRKDITSNDGLLPESFETYQIVRPGDVVFRLTDLQNDKRSLRSALVEETGIITSAYLAVTPISANSRFMSYLFRSYDTAKVFYSMGGGLRQSMKFADLKRMPTVLPPTTEQIQIAAFLDRETAKIDGLVAEQQRLMELLKEKRQAVISHAVTKGLNPDAPMKPSGVEWLGEVPAHWEVTRMAAVFGEVAEQGLDALPILSVSIHDGVSDDELADEDVDRKVTRSDDRTKYKRVMPGDLVYNMMRAWQGGFGTVTVEGMVSPAYVVARPRGRVRTQYIEHLLRTAQAVEQMRRHSRGITDFRLRLYWDEFKNLGALLPPLVEAEAICREIETMDDEFAALVSASERSIRLLMERRAALISAAVTGQIDVRHLAQEAAA